jgi:predicted O-methyltransferase YrrM
MEMEQVRESAKSVEGWLFPGEGEALYSLARQCRGKGVIVEIGSWQGKSTIWLAGGSMAGAKVPVYAIDPHTGSNEHRSESQTVWTLDRFRKNVDRAGLSELVRPIVKFSNDALNDVPEPIELLFIDGAHEYAFVKADFENWFPRLVEGGVIAFHDTLGWPGPRRVARDKVFYSRRFRQVRFVNSLAYGVKCEENLRQDRVRSRLLWWYHECYEAAFRAANLKPVKFLLKKLL